MTELEEEMKKGKRPNDKTEESRQTEEGRRDKIAI
jgi:hypothetical protein